MHFFRIVGVVLFFAPIGCSTLAKDPGKARETHPVTLGVPGALFHPSRSFGMLANIDIPSNQSQHVVSGGTGEGAYSILGSDGEADREIITNDLSVRATLANFPSKNSFFFWGLTSRYGKARTAYAEHTSGFTLAEPKTTSIDWVDHYGAAGVTLGTSIVSEVDSHFFTSLFGVSAEKQFYSRRSFLNDGTREDVDAAKRDATLASYNDLRKQVQFHYYLMSGYSF